MARKSIPWSGLAIVFAASLAGGWLLSSQSRRAPYHAQRHHRGPVALQSPIATAAPTPSQMPSPSASLATAPASKTPEATSSPATPRGSGAKLAIIIDDCGQWLDTERALIDLPIALTVSIMPNAPYKDTIAQRASAAGQGVMLHLPMEPLSGDAGTGAITTSMDDSTIEAQVRDDLKDVPLARGVNNHEGSKATADARVMHDVAEVLAEQRVYFVDSRTTAATQAAHETAALGVPTASRNVFLDNVADVASVEAALEHAADVAQTKGSAIAIGHPKAATLAALRAEIPALEREGVTFVLAQDLVQ